MISIVIPAFNEQDIVAATVEKAKSILTERALTPFEIIVVDDGSTDETAERAKAVGATVLSHPHNMGYGRALKNGIQQARYDTIVITDADGTYPLDRIPDLVREYQKGIDMVIGARQGSNLDSSVMKRILRLYLKWIVEFTTGRSIADINSGLRVFSKKTALPFFPTVSNAFSFTTSLTLAYMLSYKFVTFIPIGYHKRVGSPKVRLFRDTLRTLQYITEAILFYNPIKLFLILAGSLVLMSLILFGVSLGLHQLNFFYVGCGSLMSAFLVMAMGFLSIQLKDVLHSFPRD